MKLIKTFVIGKNQLSEVTDLLISLKDRYPIITFTGPLGAGKTTLVKFFLAQCMVEEVVTSPTFTIMNSYHNKNGYRFVHFDLYRLSSIDEFFEGGFDEYFNQPNTVVCVEWPEIIQPFLKNLSDRVCSVVLDYQDADTRLIKVYTQ